MPPTRFSKHSTRARSAASRLLKSFSAGRNPSGGFRFRSRGRRASCRSTTISFPTGTRENTMTAMKHLFSRSAKDFRTRRSIRLGKTLKRDRALRRYGRGARCCLTNTGTRDETRNRADLRDGPGRVDRAAARCASSGVRENRRRGRNRNRIDSASRVDSLALVASDERTVCSKAGSSKYMPDTIRGAKPGHGGAHGGVMLTYRGIALP